MRPTSRLSKAGSSTSTSSMSISSTDSAWASILASVASTSASWRLEREGERSDGTFHPLQHVDAQEVDEAFFAVHLAEEALAAANLRAVFGVVGRLLVGQHVAQRGVGREVQAADFVVDLADGAELAGAVHVGLDVDGLQPLGELPRLGGAVVLLDVLAGAGDGQQVEQLEVVEPQHVHEARRACARRLPASSQRLN